MIDPERADAEVERITRAALERDSLDDVGPDPADLDRLEAIDAGEDAPHANGTAPPKASGKRPRWTPSHVLARFLAEQPPPRRLELARMATLQRCTRNGIPEGSNITITGAPGSCKTHLGLQWAHEWALAGARVVVLCTDQPRKQALSRIGERMGYARDELEGLAGDEQRRAAWRALSLDLAALPNLVVLDGGEDSITIEDAAEILEYLPGDGPRVLIVDSIQEATCGVIAHAATTGLLSRIPRREQIDAAGRACRRIARRGVIVVLISEMSRGGYGSSDDRRRTSAMAASKESGSIEYRTDLLLVLQRSKADPDLVDVAVPKCRLGQEQDLRLRVERARASLIEVPREDKTKRDEVPQAVNRAARLRDAAEVAKILAGCPEGLGARALRIKVRAAGLGWGSDRTDAALDALADGGVQGVKAVDKTPGAKGRTWALVHVQEGHANPDS